MCGKTSVPSKRIRQAVTGTPPRGPSRAELFAAAHQTVPDLIAPGLKVLFCGINPGLYSAWARHHFARPGNRFWPALFAAGFSDRLLKPEEEHQLLSSGFGITNLVERATVGSDELSQQELRQGGKDIENKVRAFRPRAVAILGVTAYRVAFAKRHAIIGAQPDGLSDSLVWVLPNPSGLNAHFTPPALAKLFRELRLRVAV